MSTEEQKPPKDYDPLVPKWMINKFVGSAEKDISEMLGVKKTSIENIDAAIDGLYDAHKLGIVGEIIKYSCGMLHVSIDSLKYRISEGALTPEEQQALDKKVRQLELKYPAVERSYTINPVIEGAHGRQTNGNVEIVTNIGTKADPDEAFSLTAIFNIKTKEMILHFDKPVDAENMRLKEKTAYVLDTLEEMGVTRKDIIKFFEYADYDDEQTGFLRDITDDANKKFGGSINLTPALFATEIVCQVEREKAENIKLSNANDTKINNNAGPSDNTAPPPPGANM